MSLVSRLLYGGVDALIAVFLSVLAYPAPFSDTVALFLFCRAAMSLFGLRLAQNSGAFKLFYGAADLLVAAFFVTSAASLGGSSGGIGVFLIVRGVLTLLGVYIG